MIADKQTDRQTDTLITILRFPIAGGVTSCYNRLTARGRTAAVLGLPYVRVSPDTSSFLAFVRAPGQVFENRRFVRVFGRIRKYIRTLPTAKAYDGMRQRKARNSFCTTQFQASVMERLLHIPTDAVNRNC